MSADQLSDWIRIAAAAEIDQGATQGEEMNAARQAFEDAIRRKRAAERAAMPDPLPTLADIINALTPADALQWLSQREIAPHHPVEKFLEAKTGRTTGVISFNTCGFRIARAGWTRIPLPKWILQWDWRVRQIPHAPNGERSVEAVIAALKQVSITTLHSSPTQ